MEIEFDPSILDPNERLLYALYSPDIKWTRDIGYFHATYKGMPVRIHGSQITKTDGGGIMGAMLGISTKIVKQYWEYRLSMSADDRYDSVEISTGDFNSHIDSLLEDLYWHVHNLHHDRKVADIIAKLEEG